LLSSYASRWLVYYGVARVGTDGTFEIQKRGQWVKYRVGSRNMPFGYVEGVLFDLVAVGINVRHVRDENEAATWIGCLYRWWQKPWAKHKGLHVFDRSRELSLLPGLDDDTHFRASVAKELPGLGYERAVAAAKHFTSVTAMINATAEEWAKVPGIGKVVAKAIVEALR
jgi:ERCC4-type nuclease